MQYDNMTDGELIREADGHSGLIRALSERLDMRRVELTHDVLCSVVASSRDMRHEREARDEAERQLAAQRERGAAAKSRLRSSPRTSASTVPARC